MSLVSKTLPVGIRDRDYMKRQRPSDDDGRGGSSDSKAEEIAQKFLNKFPRFLAYFGIGLVVLIVVTLIIIKLTGTKHQ
jgi:hypothetical protein